MTLKKYKDLDFDWRMAVATLLVCALCGFGHAAAVIPADAGGSGSSTSTTQQTQITSSPAQLAAAPEPAASCSGDNCDLVKKYLNPAIKLLSAIVGLIIVVGIIYGSVEYASSGGDPQRATSGRKHITNAMLALVTFILLYAFLNFLIPGGI